MEEEKSRHMRWMQTNKALLGTVGKEAYQPYSIPLVPNDLRKWNERAYMPKVVSIGPRYWGRGELLQMEEIKWRCITSLLSRIFGPDSIEGYLEAVLELDAVVRASYVDEITLDKYALATIMAFDGCFLLELLVCGSKLESEVPIPYNGISPGIEVIKMDHVISDLMLPENQIPIFILETLFENLLGSSHQMRKVMLDLALPLFGLSGKMMVQSTFHFLDIAHSCIKLGWMDKKIEENEVRIDIYAIDTKLPMQAQHLNRCTMKLEAAGITIQPLKNDDDSEHINFKLATDFNKSKGILQIHTLIITKTTEVSWRSFIAWEHHKKKLKNSSYSSVSDTHSICTFTALLFKDLICCRGDVQRLKDRGVLIDYTGKSNRDLMAFFHSITGGVDRGIIDHKYTTMFHDLNTFSSPKYATKIFLLLFHFFCKILDWLCYDVPKFLKRGYHFAATTVTLMTIVQTCYTIAAYHHSK